MITHSIRTSKYTTTIDIPAQKLQTRAKFIQISKSSSNPRQQTITIPNVCYQKQQQNRRLTLQTKLMIQELQHAYNQDVGLLKQEISNLKTVQDIQRLKLQNTVQNQRRQLQLYKKHNDQSQSQLKQSRDKQQSIISNLQVEIKTKQQLISNSSNQINNLQITLTQIRKELNEKNNLLMSKFRQFQTDKDKRYNESYRLLELKLLQQKRQKQDMRRQLQRQIQRLRQQNKHNMIHEQRLDRQNLSYKQQYLQVKKEINFQINQINTYINNLKQLQLLKSHLQQTNSILHQKLQQQNLQIQKLLTQMRQQRLYIDNHVNNNQFQTSVQQIKILRAKLDDYSLIIQQKDKQITQHKTQYLIKLKQIDDQKLNTKKYSQLLSTSNNQITTLTNQLTNVKKQYQIIKSQLTNKIVQYNQLLSRPPQHYDVKIQKTIDKKQYIQELQNKVQQLQSIINQLKQDNSSYIEQIRKKIRDQQSAKLKQQQLLKSNQQLKQYISNKQKSIGWAVQRQIMKDVEISRNISSQKTNGYKVFVRNSHTNSQGASSNLEVSGIHGGRGVNFSVQSKLQQILDKKQIKSSIQGQSYSGNSKRIQESIYKAMNGQMSRQKNESGINESKNNESY